jgi:hypothetical protein
MPGAFIRSLLPGLLFVVGLDAGTTAAQAPPPGRGKDALIPGARLMHKFAKEVYRVPVLVTTDKGPQLEVWFDEFDPSPPPRPGQIPGITRLPDPKMDLVIWDPIANKELHRLSHPKVPLTFPYTSTELQREGGMAISPDGKRLATKTSTYTPRPGSPYGDFTTRVGLIDLATRKVQPLKTYQQQRAPGALQVFLLFAPDGALVTLRSTTVTVQEPGKAKPRTSFTLQRAAKHQLMEFWFSIKDAILSPDGSQLAVAADGTIIIYDLATGKKLFAAPRAAPEMKKTGDPLAGNAALAYAPGAKESQLLTAESLVASQGGQKDFIMVRLFDLKNKKELKKWTIKVPPRPDFGGLGNPNPLGNAGAEGHSATVSAYWTAKGEPRLLYDGKVFDAASGKELHRFNPGTCTFVSRDGKVLVRMTRKNGEARTMQVEVWSLDAGQ